MFLGFSLALHLVQNSQLRLPHIISDHMMLQRGGTAKIWGWDKPGQKVKVTSSWNSESSTTLADKNGTWMVSVKTSLDVQAHEMTIEGSSKIILNDIIFGDVWVCSGQSNMEWPMSATNHANEDISAATQPKIRLFQVQNVMSPTPQTDCNGTWMTCSPDSVRNFSAVGYLFGKELTQKTGIPMGLIDSTWGGTEAELWTSQPSLLKLPDFAQAIKARASKQALYDAQLSDWQQTVESQDEGFKNWTTGGSSGWQQANTLLWSQDEKLKNFDGAVWYRATFNAPANWAGQKVELNLGMVDDDEITWVNGTRIGATDGYNVNRRYDLPTGIVKAGANTVVIRVWDFVAEGGWSEDPKVIRATCEGTQVQLTNFEYKIGPSSKDVPARPQMNSASNSLLYNGMIHPIIKFPIKGAIWYQGEANVGRAKQYATLFPAMISDWRRAWKQTFPFYFVQIAPFRGYGSAAAAELRESQNAALRLKKTGVVIVTDATGNLDDIHPVDKRTPAHRLALWSLANDYGQKGIEFSGPIYHSMQKVGDSIELTFTHNAGLSSDGQPLREFEIAGQDQKFVSAVATIVGDKVIVRASGVNNPVAVRMGWSTAPAPNLFNRAGLPASPFRTDSWPGLTERAKWGM